MEIEIVLITIVFSLILAYIFHNFNKKRNFKKHIGEAFYTFLLIISIVLFPISVIVGRWDGLFLAGVGVYLFFPSLFGFIFIKILKKYN